MFVVAAMVVSSARCDSAEPAPVFEVVGIIGLDTSHVGEFTKLLNSPNPAADLAGVRVVAAFPAGSDIPASRDRRAKFTEQIKATGVEIVDSIPALLDKVDVVLLESVDGRTHLEQVRPVFKAGKPVFIDKPLAGSLKDAVAIADLGETIQDALGSLVPHCDLVPPFKPCETTRRSARSSVAQLGALARWSSTHHPDLYWYGIHGVETLYTIMGTGCETVARTHTDGADMAVGVWKGGRVGIFRGIREGKEDYGATVFGKAGIVEVGHNEGYRQLVAEIVKFFKTRHSPVDTKETIEMMVFMEAADESERQGGKPVALADVLAKAGKGASVSGAVNARTRKPQASFNELIVIESSLAVSRVLPAPPLRAPS